MKASIAGMIMVAGLFAGCDSGSDDAGPSDASTDADACPMIPPGCVDSCRDEQGSETHPWGVTARTCKVVTNEQGCPELDFTTEDCRPGVCYTHAYLAVGCVPPVECASTACTCPEGSPCSCALDSCTVSCEGDCIVSLSGSDGTVVCADGAWCQTTCTGSNCTTSCATDSTCTQDCDGAGCLLACDAAETCSQQCSGTDCHVECETAADCSQDCDAPGECTCSGCP